MNDHLETNDVTEKELIVLPSLAARPGPDGGLILTKKYLAGVAEYASSWPGKVTSLVAIDNKPSTEMDLISVLPSSSNPGLEIRPQGRKELAERLQNAAVVFAGLTGDELELAEICSRLSIPLVLNSEYTLKTEKQIIDANTKNPILRWRRKLWANGNHRRRMKALRLATSLQCSGTPTYREYSNLKDNTLLFFDNRVNEADVISSDGLATRLASSRGQPLRLAFGGRFIPMKGVLDLIAVADELIENGLEFTFEIIGSGPLEQKLKQSIHRRGLSGRVNVKPPMDFTSEWIPYLKNHVDLFVCCHPQGDPSSTYPEVMSCGVPIVGYANEAFEGIAELSNGGRSTALSPQAVAAEIVKIVDKTLLPSLAQQARVFALEHTFEKTFIRRVAHMVESSRLNSSTKTTWFAQHQVS